VVERDGKERQGAEVEEKAGKGEGGLDLEFLVTPLNSIEKKQKNKTRLWALAASASEM